MSLHNEIKLLICTIGVIFTFLYYGILQEAVYRVPYHDSGSEEYFTYTFILIFFKVLMNSVISFIPLVYKKDIKGPVPLLDYCRPATSQLVASYLADIALQYVSYPTRTLAKSCKPIPILLTVFLSGTVNYSKGKFLVVGVITAGISAFMMENVKSGGGDDPLGYIMLVGSLLCDGLTANFQEKFRNRDGRKPDAYHLMFYNNFWSLGIIAIYILSGVIFGLGTVEGIEFCYRNPSVVVDLALLGIVGAIGEMFIFYMLDTFGSLTTSIITTMRKFLTILASVIWYGHTLSVTQWGYVILVFSGLIADRYFKF
eukprot:TRINITY_DN12497_c0_g1_i1.p1 TRINITY_DN12497_c0_g1~~TRINITY_DN12497_c0_g1_i1.p1  ORF type:complete len:313 (-),score=41.68 TRINITY_DN12497_c0_g1_i1:33-971(-)